MTTHTSPTPHVRPAHEEDVAAIRSLALDNGMFAPEEMAGFDGMLRGYLDGELDGHRWVVAEDGTGAVVGAAYYAPEPFSDRLWNLYFLAVDPRQQRSGTGALLVGHVQDDLRRAGEGVARVLLVETSSTDDYAGARTFYLREDFDHEATIRDFYGPGDAKIVFWKSLLT